MDDLGSVFAVEVSISELVLRGSVMYLGLIVLSRFFLRRESGSGGLTDVLVVVLLADAAQNGMAGGYQSVTEGLILVVTLLAWTVVLDALALRWAWLARFVHPPALLLVRDGTPLVRNLRRELLTMDELLSALRAHGVERLDEVKEARMEGDGSISVLRRSG